jgi:hypothetical protein
VISLAKLLFDVNRQLDIPTLILEAKSGKRYGSIDGASELVYKKSMMNPNELSFKVSKYIDGKVNYLWDNITDLKTIYIPEYEEKFQVSVNYSDDELEEKSLTGIDLCAAELGQIKIRGLEVNTDEDLKAHNYNITKFYNGDNHDLSLIHRVLKRCPHYKLEHVDSTLCDLSFEFSADDISVYDFLTGDVAEKIQCLFVFDSMTRSIKVYDLCSTCNDCYDEVIGKDQNDWKHYRDDFHDVCPKCGKTNIRHGYGKDTTVLIDRENIATSITRETDVDSLKNCFHVSGGDDLIDAAFMMSNPNGSQYIYRLTDDMMDEMPDEFKDAWNNYYELYKNYNTTKTFNIDNNLKRAFDTIVGIISSLGEGEEPYSSYKNHITPTLKGMKSLVAAYYNAIDLESFIKTSMCPSYKIEEYDKYEALARLNSNNLGNGITKNNFIAIPGLDGNTTKTIVNNAVLKKAKTLVNTALYDIEIVNSEFQYNANGEGVWNGIFSIEDRQNDDDATNTITNINYQEIAYKEGKELSEEIKNLIKSPVTVYINDDIVTYCKNNIEKVIADSDLPVANELYNLDISEEYFDEMIPLYSIANLGILNDVIQSCLDTLTEQITNSKNGSSVITELKSYYKKYEGRMKKITSEINIKNSYIDTIVEYEEAFNSQIKQVHEILDIEKYMKKKSLDGMNLWDLFNYYRREDTYKNEHIISDNIKSSNVSLLQYADYLFKFAEKELIKASTPQMTINGNLYNLLMLPEFEPILELFEVGNWIRVRTDINEEKAEDSIYKLRLLSYQINFDEQESIDVEFSTVTQTWSGMRDIQNILETAQTIGTSFDGVKREVEKTIDVTKTVSGWVNDGLDLTNQKIVSNANNQSIVIDDHGILARKYDDITETYDKGQLKIFNNGLYTTSDNWESIDAGIGAISYIDPETRNQVDDFGVIAKTVIGKLILGEKLGIYNGDASLKFTKNGLSVSNDKNTININPNGNVFEILKGAEQQMCIDDNGNIYLKGSIEATSGKFKGSIESGSTITGSVISGGTLSGTVINNGNGTFSVDGNGRIVAKSGKIAAFEINQDYIYGEQGDVDKQIIRIGVDGIVATDIDGSTVRHTHSCSTYTSADSNALTIIDNNGLTLSSHGSYIGIDFVYENNNCLTIASDGIYFMESNGTYYIHSDGTAKLAGIEVTGAITAADRILATGGLSSSSNINLNSSDTSKRSITTSFADSKIHDMLVQGSDLLTTAIGWEGSSDYKTKLILRGQEVRLKNASGEMVTSDERLKNSLAQLDEFDDVFMDLEPISFKYNNGSSGRKHFGFGASQVRDTFLNHGFTTKDFGGFVQTTASENDEDYEGLTDPMGLIYTEFVSWNTHMIQKTIKELNETKQEVTDLQKKYDNLVEFVGFTG